MIPLVIVFFVLLVPTPLPPIPPVPPSEGTWYNGDYKTVCTMGIEWILYCEVWWWNGVSWISILRYSYYVGPPSFADRFGGSGTYRLYL